MVGGPDPPLILPKLDIDCAVVSPNLTVAEHETLDRDHCYSERHAKYKASHPKSKAEFESPKDHRAPHSSV